ncbi:glycoside hydrolase family 10 protein [Virgisporangium ochraceum]|uniref:alpha-amylase n=1 Tax=Virgisporangium ochraceum TaxID=65505 RepID=A0A8J4EEW3_9ACTN|nr:family 10 glycosylhydrolase [Virgisporangium ochraceum]GIJ72189.1 hypothetical protein Voc01_071060 [Virgisporangium ochraceum]
MRRFTAGVAVAAVMLVTTGSVAPVPPAPVVDGPSADGASTGQWRSFWVDSFHPGIYTPAEVDTLVADARAANVNALIVQAGRWADCYCNRSTFPRTHAPVAPPPYDPLEYVIRKAHAAGIELHAWVNTTPVWNTTAPPPQPDHILHTHGSTATGADRWLNKRVDGAEVGGATMRSLDPANPAAVDYYVAGIASIVRAYDIDGIHLDYIRYPDNNSSSTHSDWGYSEVSLARFRAATGRAEPPAPDDPAFSAWRRAQVTNYVRKVYLTMASIKPRLRLSHSAIVYGRGPQAVGGWTNTRTYAEVYQDWRGWLAEGIMDLTIGMNYKREGSPDQARMFQEWNQALADSAGRRHTAVGPGLYLNTVEQSLAQSRRALTRSPAGNTVVGWSGYAYAAPSAASMRDPALARADRDRLIAGLTTNDPTGQSPLFAGPATVPAMPWKERPTSGHVAGTLVLTDGTPLDQVPVTLTHTRSGRTVDGRVTDGSGWFGFVDLAPGTWRVDVTLPRGVRGPSTTTVDVRAGAVATPRLAPLT